MYGPDPSWPSWGRGEIGAVLVWNLVRPRFYNVSRVNNINNLQLSTATITLPTPIAAIYNCRLPIHISDVHVQSPPYP